MSSDKEPTSVPKGSYLRKPSQFRSFIGRDEMYPAEAGRYHLYVSYACPWAHRTLIMRSFKGLEEAISLSVVSPDMDLSSQGGEGWTFRPDQPDVIPDTVNGKELIREIYHMVEPDYSGNYSVPILFDKKTNTIVNNESSEIIRMFNTSFNDLPGRATTPFSSMDFYPEPLRSKIDDVNEFVYHQINNGVYKCGFAKTQEAYDAALTQLVEGLNRVESILSKSRYMCGDTLTEADIRLFVTLIRFDAVYYVHFKCAKTKISELPNTFEFLKEVYQMPGVKGTTNWHHIVRHYFFSHKIINPFAIVAPLPSSNDRLDEPHNRGD